MVASRIAKRKSVADRDIRDAEKLYRQLKTAPGIASADAEKMERAWLDPKRHIWRRAALAVLSMPPGEMFRKIETDRDAAVIFARTARDIRDYLTWQRDILDLLNKAQVRIEIGLCKEG